MDIKSVEGVVVLLIRPLGKKVFCFRGEGLVVYVFRSFCAGEGLRPVEGSLPVRRKGGKAIVAVALQGEEGGRDFPPVEKRG